MYQYDGFVQDCCISCALAIGLPQSCPKPSNCFILIDLTISYIIIIHPIQLYHTVSNLPTIPKFQEHAPKISIG